MNKTYSIVFNTALGLWVVANEFAKGRKKSARTKKALFLALLLPTHSALADACDSSSLPFQDGASVGVYACYVSGALVDNDNNGKVDNVDGTDTANYKAKEQRFNQDTRFSLSNDVLWKPEVNGPTTALPVTYVPASELYNKGALTVTDKDGNVLSELPTFSDWNLNATGGKDEITWTRTDGTPGTAEVYNTSAIQITKDIDSATGFSAQIITDQPTLPFVDLRIATITDGMTMDVVSNGQANADGFAIDWKPGQMKQSSLFAADNGTINQAADTAFRVVFDYTDGVSNPSDTNKVPGDFGPSLALSGSTITFQGNNYTIDTVAALDTYNHALIAAIKDNTLTSSEYDTEFRKAFKNGTDEYHYEYDPIKVDYTDFYISPEMSAAIGKRAIFEANGTGVVNLNANVAAIGQTYARAYNAWAHDGGTVNNNGDVIVNNSNTQNALIESGATFNNTGSITFNVNGTNWADQVSGTGSTYNNTADGVISVSTSTANNANAAHPNSYFKNSRNIATEVLNGARAINSGKYFIGSAEPSAGTVGTATGVHITNSGSFTNSGEMTIGKDAAGNDIALKGGKNTETLYVEEAYNAVSAYVDNSGSSITITNSGTGVININDGAKNSVAMNIGEAPVLNNMPGSTFTPTNVTVENAGIINVDGKNSAGLKAAGAFTQANNDTIINTGTINVTGAGSTGIFSASGSEITNSGSVVVTGVANSNNRAYGIRADNATVTLDNNSQLTVLGSNTTGLYARTGGQINVNGGTINAPLDPAANDQVVFWISGKSGSRSSTISFANPTYYALENSHSTLFRVDQGATYDGSSSNLERVDVIGTGSNGYTIANNGTHFTSGGTTINVNGQNATGINVNSGAGLDNNVKLTEDTNITVTGTGSTIATVDGNTYNVQGVKTGQNGAKLITSAALAAGVGGQIAANAIGYKIINQGELVQNGTIDFSNADFTTGVFIDGGTLTNNGAIASNGIGVDVYQTSLVASVVNNSSDIKAIDGTAAVRLNENASLSVGGSGKIEGSGSADAIRVMSGASLFTSGAKISVDGSGSGIHFLNTMGDTSSTFKLSGSGNIGVTGNNSAGITLEGLDASGNPAQSNANLDTRGSEQLLINVHDQSGNGIVTNTSGYVYSGTSVNIASPNGQSALVVKGTTKDIRQTGDLTSASASSPVIDLTQLANPAAIVSFINNGKITAPSGGVAVDAGNISGKTTFTNQGAGAITGAVALGQGNNAITLAGSSSATDFTTGNGNNAITVKDGAKLIGTLATGNGSNAVTLQGTSETNALTLGNGGNTVDIYGGTKNGTLTSGSGNDSYMLHAVNVNNATPAQSENAFSRINGGAGTDLLTATDASWYTLIDSQNIQGIEYLNVEKNSTFEVHNVDLALVNAGGTTNTVSLDNSSTYFVNFDAASAGYQLKQNIKGGGTIRTRTNGQAFDFANADYIQNNFTGTLAIGDGTFAVQGDNTKSLAHATLQLDEDGIASLAKGLPTQTIDSLHFNSGTLKVAEGLIGSKENALQSHLQVTVLDVSGPGAVQVVADGFDNDYSPQNMLEDTSRLSLLSQDEGINLVTLVKATGTVTGTANNITFSLTDDSGMLLPGSEDQLQDIRQDGERVADGTYGIGANIGLDRDGLYAAFQLKQIDMLGGKIVNLITSEGDTGNALDLGAKLTGAGNVNIEAYGNYLSLSNSNNDYTGSTTVSHGTLLLRNDAVLGQQESHTSALNLMAVTQAQLGETTQYVGALNTQQTSSLALNSGTLNVDNGGSVAGQIISEPDATLNVNGGTLDITSSNPNYHGITNIAKPTVTNIHYVNGLGDGNIDLMGALNITGAPVGNFANVLSSTGHANIIAGSDVNLTADNRAFTGDFNIDVESTLRASSAHNLADGVKDAEPVTPVEPTEPEEPTEPPTDEGGEGTPPADPGTAVNIHNNGNLVLTNAQPETWMVHNAIDGSGNLYKQGSGTLELTQQAAEYTGQTFVTEGALTAGLLPARERIDDDDDNGGAEGNGSQGSNNEGTDSNESAAVLLAAEDDSPETANNVNMATSALNIAQGASFGGYGSVAGDVNNTGTFNVGGLDKLSLSNTTTYQVNGSFRNAGDIILGSKNITGSTLHIGKDYVSQGGALYLNTALNKGAEETDTDQVFVGGNVRTDTDATRIYVTNVGGNGAYTQPDAIKLVDVKGVSDNSAFVLGHPTVIGVYEYLLKKGAKDNNWYLSSIEQEEVIIPIDPTNPMEPTNPTNPTEPTRPTTSAKHYINPMIGGFAANQNASSMFNMTLHDRLGEPQYADSLREDGDFSHSLWLRMVGSHQRYNAIDDQMRLSGHSTVVQLGHDLIHWSDNGKWRGRAGIMGGIGNQQFSSKSRITGRSARANVDNAYSLGLYGTLYQNDKNPLGTYVDTWALYNWYRNNVGMSGYSDAKYNSRGYNLSIEAGHTLEFGKDVEKQRAWQLQPQAQLTYGQLSSDAASSQSALLNVSKNRATSLESRLGVRLTRAYGLSNGESVQPFAEVNWRHQYRENTLTFNEQYDFKNAPPKSRYELKLGVEGQRNKNLNGWVNVSYSVGDKDYREPKAMMGVKYQW